MSRPEITVHKVSGAWWVFVADESRGLHESYAAPFRTWRDAVDHALAWRSTVRRIERMVWVGP